MTSPRRNIIDKIKYLILNNICNNTMSLYLSIFHSEQNGKYIVFTIAHIFFLKSIFGPVKALHKELSEKILGRKSYTLCTLNECKL